MHTLPLEEDNLLGNHFVCPRYSQLVADVMSSAEMAKINEENAQLYAYLTEKTGRNVSDMVTVDYVYDTLYIEALYNKTLPEWTKAVFPDKMRRLRDLSFTLTTWTPELARLRAGPLIDNIVQTFRQVESSSMEPTERKMLMYSGHDTTLSSHLNALGLFNPPVAPPYASAVLWELWRDADGGHSVSILYRNDTRPDGGQPVQLHLAGCPQPPARCSLDSLDAATAHLRPADWRGECGQQDPFARAVTLTSVVVCAGLFVLLFMSIVAVMVSRRRRSLPPVDMGYASINQQEDQA